MNFLPSLNPNTLIIAVVVLVAIFAMMLGQSRLRLIVLSTFVGIVIASQLSAQVKHFIPSVPEMDIRLALLALPILLFGLLPGAHSANKGSFIPNLIAGILAGALIVSAALYIMPPGDLANITTNSLFATELVNFRLAILVLAPVSLLFGMAMKPKDKHR